MRQQIVSFNKLIPRIHRDPVVYVAARRANFSTSVESR